MGCAHVEKWLVGEQFPQQVNRDALPRVACHVMDLERIWMDGQMMCRKCLIVCFELTVLNFVETDASELKSVNGRCDATMTNVLSGN